MRESFVKLFDRFYYQFKFRIENTSIVNYFTLSHCFGKI